MASPRPVTGDEVPSLLRLLNDVFYADVSAPIEVSFPLFFDSAHTKLDDFRVLEVDGQIVSHVGVCQQKAVLEQAELDVAWIGAVATDPGYRSRGFAGLLLRDALNVLRERECQLALLNGPRRLYEGFGFDLVGSELRVRLSAHCLHGLADAGARIWRFQGSTSDVGRIAAAHDAEVVRIDRTESDTEKLLGVPFRSTYCASDEPNFAYVVLDESRIEHREGNFGVVMDFGGELRLVARLLEYLFGYKEFETVCLQAGFMRDERCQLLAQIADGYTVGPFVSVRIVSLRGLLEKVGPVLSQRYSALEHPGASTLEIEWYEGDRVRERVCLELESGTLGNASQAGVCLRLDSLGLVQLLFGPRLLPTTVRRDAAEESELIESLFPLELYAAPLDRQ